ncbi:hypothetical protein D9M72_594540 [compost metagenome]
MVVVTIRLARGVSRNGPVAAITAAQSSVCSALVRAYSSISCCAVFALAKSTRASMYWRSTVRTRSASVVSSRSVRIHVVPRALASCITKDLRSS